jgi:hypothetical protein
MKSLVGLCLLSLVGMEASAQRPTLGTLQEGDTVKVWAVGPRLNGDQSAFGGIRSDTVTLRALPFGPDAMVRARVPYMSLRRVDVRRGSAQSKGRTFAGAVIGGAGGLVLGAMLGPIIECGGADCGGTNGLEGIAGFVVGGGLGLVAGGIVGGVYGARPRPRWESVDLRVTGGR